MKNLMCYKIAAGKLEGFSSCYIACKQQIQRCNVSQNADFEHEQHLKILNTDKQKIRQSLSQMHLISPKSQMT